MATLTKPKKVKPKKQRVSNEQIQAKEEEEEEEHDELSTSYTQEQRASENVSLLEELERVADLTSSNNNPEAIISHGCYISGDVVPRTDEPTATDDAPIAEAATHELAEPTPSAPIAPMPNVQLIQYPNLQPIRVTNALIEEQKTNIVYRTYQTQSPGFALTSSHLKPFTSSELKEVYRCADLDLVKQFELEFLMNTLLESSETDPLYLALQEYYTLQGKLTSNLHDVADSRKKCLDAQQVVWKREPVTRSFSGTCADNNVVRESVTYDCIKVDQVNLQAVGTSLASLYELVCNTYTTNLITAKITKIKIDHIVDKLLAYPHVQPHATVGLHVQLDNSALECVAQLRRAISILFNFARRPSPNAAFDADLKLWLRKLVALQLLLATKEDHWFLLFNILRCPNGVGTWAAEFLQLPGMVAIEVKPKGSQPNEMPLPLDSPELNHCIAVLQILLLPIKKRNEYLKSQAKEQRELSSATGANERWTVVDSDGEDAQTSTGECVGLKATDLIALLNQLPFERLFTSVLCIEKFLNDYIIEPDMITPQRMLTVVAFFAQLVETIGEGMVTYNNERYKQLAKRLGRLVRHCLQYVYDYHELFIQNNLSKPQELCERIELELQALLLRACSYIYRSRNLGTWHYFSTLPYTTLNADIIWHLFYYLNIGFPSDLNSQLEVDVEAAFQADDFWRKFDVANADVSPEDMYYLLQAFFEMADERDPTKDWPLIRHICLTIFQIGFIHQTTRDFCYKTARDMLVNITLAYENLLDSLLLQLKARYGDMEQAAYLFKALPLENWRPTMDSFELLSNWLLHFDYQTVENQLARLIIGHLNWGFDSENRLYLPHNIHVRMACLVTEAITKHAPELLGASGISESVRQVSSLIDSSVSSREQFTNWCWRMISMLRLHLMDQSVESVKHTIQHPTEPLLFVPDLERLEMVWQGVVENRPLALYVGILISLHGHSIPIICQHGFELLQRLISDHRHAVVIRCLELIVPLFLETPDTLANCESFQKLLDTLLNADRTYLKMAKDMVYANAIGPILELFDNMLHHQIVSYTSYGLCSPLNLINVWLNCFTALPGWAQNSHVLYLLDKILRLAYLFPDCRVQAVEFFYNLFKDCTDWKTPPKASGLKAFFGGQINSPIPAILPQYCWLNLILLEIEFRLQDTRFWAELLRQLTALTVEPALKKTLAFSKSSVFPVQQLVIYKYAQLLASMDTTHAVFPIVCQKFFELYLWRVPVECDIRDLNQSSGVAEKFYEYNVTQMKTIKAQLKSAEVFYAAIATKRAQDDAIAHLYRSCAQLMQSCALWLEDTQINRFSSDTRQLPAQYNNEKLHELLNGHVNHWTEFLNPGDLRKEQRQQSDQWSAKIYRTQNQNQLRSPLQSKTRLPPAQRIKKHLVTYDKCLPPPNHVQPTQLQKQRIDGNTLPELKRRIKTLNSTANKYHYNTSELISLNLNYLERVPSLYQMVPYNETRRKECGNLLFKRNCTMPAEIKLVLEHIRLNEQVSRKQEQNRERHDKIIDEMLTLNVDGFAQAIEELGVCVQQLLLEQSRDNKSVTDIGVNFFYHVVDNMMETTMKFQPTNEFFSQLLTDLGIFIQENQAEQGLAVLRLTLRRGDLVKLLSGVFVPCRTESEYFLEMYQFLIDSHLKRCDTKILFVLLSKFDLLSWLESHQPKLSEINRLLLLVLQGLESWSQPDSSLLQDQFRRQLVHIFMYDFPQHYGEVMQLVLDRISDQKLMPVVLLDLLNALLASANSQSLSLNCSELLLHDTAMDFARRQKLFTLKATTDTLLLFARHFQKERLHHGLHGLYPKHKDYCQPLIMWFTCFGHVLLAAAICSYQELLGDQISDIVFGSIVETYAPWLIPYTEHTEQAAGAAAHWIRQLTPDQGKMLLPWSEPHASSSKILIKSFIGNIKQVVQYLPASSKILEHAFAWYVHHFAQLNVAGYVLAPIHDGMAQLPWERFLPPVQHIDLLYESLQRYLPVSHAMLGHIFIRIDWNDWFAQAPQPIGTLSRLFVIFVKLAFEPNIHMHPNTSKILEDAIKYPWHLVEYSELEQLLKWFVASVEPVIVLKIPTETNYADRAVLDLLRVACAMQPESNAQASVVQATAKRMLYTRAMVSMQRACGPKHKKLLATKEGERAFTGAFLELLQSIDQALSSSGEQRTLEEQRREAINLMIELTAPTQTQSEEISTLHIQTLVRWQQQCAPANIVMCAALPAIGHLNTYISCIYMLLESSIECYFRKSTEQAPWHAPSWQGLFEALQMSLPKLELMPVMRGGYFFSLHVFVLYKLEEIKSHGEKVSFLQDLTQLLENLKTDPVTEPRLALVWGLIISRGCKLLLEAQHIKKPLCMLARHLQLASTKADSWSDGLLGVIGLKSENITNKRRVLTRCLACIIYSLFPANRELRLPCEDYESGMRELAMLLANKKFTDVRSQIVSVVSILKEQLIPDLRAVPHLVCRVIDVFYNQSYLTTIPEVWDCDFNLKAV